MFIIVCNRQIKIKVYNIIYKLYNKDIYQVVGNINICNIPI